MSRAADCGKINSAGNPAEYLMRVQQRLRLLHSIQRDELISALPQDFNRIVDAL